MQSADPRGSPDEVLISVTSATFDLQRQSFRNRPQHVLAKHCTGGRPVFVQVHLHPGTIGALPGCIERKCHLQDKARARGRQRRDSGKMNYKKAGAETPKSTGRSPMRSRIPAVLTKSRLFTLRLRRATVLLSRFSISDGFADENTVGPLSRISHVGGRPQPGSAQYSLIRSDVSFVLDILENNNHYLINTPNANRSWARGDFIGRWAAMLRARKPELAIALGPEPLRWAAFPSRYRREVQARIPRSERGARALEGPAALAAEAATLVDLQNENQSPSRRMVPASRSRARPRLRAESPRCLQRAAAGSYQRAVAGPLSYSCRP